MALSASLHLRQSQSLVMTPQLMQSIQLLQMTHAELTQFIEREVEKNPLLELNSSDEVIEPAEEGREKAPDQDASDDWYSNNDGTNSEQLSSAMDANFSPDYDSDGPTPAPDAPELASQWKSMPGNSGGDTSSFDIEDFAAADVSLREFVGQQVPFAFSTNSDLMIAQHLTDMLDDCGYIQADLGELAERLGTTQAAIDRVLVTLQTLEPAGIFARSLSECLAIQLRQRDRCDPAMTALVENLELLAQRDFATLKKKCGVDEEDLVDMLAEIRHLDPKPGSRFSASQSETVIPDILVQRGPDNVWQIELNQDTLPRVLVNQAYYAEVSSATPKNSEDHAFLSECMQNASWLTRSLDQRARTIMKVAAEIVRHQDEFLQRGVEYLRPLNLKTVAEAIKMHESTVSRVTSNKYMLTPRGLFELRYFFSVSIASSDGSANHSAEAVRCRIKSLIDQESAKSVLSDDDIVDKLKEAGIDLARRTVAKYREAMNIPSSVQRRREKRALAKAAAV